MADDSQTSLQATTTNRVAADSLRSLGLTIALSLTAMTLWSYWPTIVSLAKEWWRNEDYSIGMLVPPLALYFLWRQRKAFSQWRISPCWWAIALVLLAQAARALGLLLLYESAERYSLVLTIFALVLLVAGWRVLLKVFWILAFLFLMIPLPGRVHNLITGPLQTMAATASVFILEVFGVMVSQQGNIIVLNDRVPLAVAEACNGLRMLTGFVVVAATIAYLANRPRWQKVTVIVSSIPIAIACNLARLCMTAVLYLVAGSQIAEKFFHDFVGLAMMPAAVLLIFGELWLLNKLVISDGQESTATE